MYRPGREATHGYPRCADFVSVYDISWLRTVPDSADPTQVGKEKRKPVSENKKRTFFHPVQKWRQSASGRPEAQSVPPSPPIAASSGLCRPVYSQSIHQSAAVVVTSLTRSLHFSSRNDGRGEVEPGRVKNDPLSLAVVIATVAWHVTWSEKKRAGNPCVVTSQNARLLRNAGLPTSGKGERGEGEGKGGRCRDGGRCAKMRPQDKNSPPELSLPANVFFFLRNE